MRTARGLLLICFTWLMQTVLGFGRVYLGIDVLVANDFLPIRGKRVGLITHAAAVDHRGVPTAEHFRRARSIKLVAFYAPEHGIDGKAPAGHYVPHRIDQHSGLPVYSLYGPTRKPTPDMLRGIDVLVFDMQDIGARSYTFISTMGLAMRAASENGIEFMVLDRPNPLGGLRVEGPPLDPAYRSFVGQYEIPYVYGLTIGELAFYLNETSWMAQHPLRLHVVKMRGWRRSMLWEDTGLRWIPTSPNIPEPRSAFDYVATGWLGELGTVNNGIFTDYPFQVVGLPNLDCQAFLRAIYKRHPLHGIQLSKINYMITKGRFTGQTYTGVRLRYTDLHRARLTEFSPVVLLALRDITGKDFVTSAAAHKLEMFDKVTGSSTLRNVLVKSPQKLNQLFLQWEKYAEEFQVKRQQFLLYPE